MDEFVLQTSLARKNSLNIGNKILNKEIIRNKNNWPSFKRLHVPDSIEKVFSKNMNFLNVIIGATRPTANKIVAIAKSNNKNFLYVLTFKVF